MTNEQVVNLQHAESERFRSLATHYGLMVAGPSKRGCFLVKESDGRTWLFGSEHEKFGRQCLPSVWTDLNVSVMNQTNGIWT